MTLDKAIALLKKNYEYALTKAWIRNPLAWALYETWKEVEYERIR